MKVLMTMAAALMLLVGTASAQVESPIGSCTLDAEGQKLCCNGNGAGDNPLSDGYISCSMEAGNCCADDNGQGDQDGVPGNEDPCGNDGGESPTCIPG